MRLIVRLLTFISVILLMACQGTAINDDPPNHGYGWGVDGYSPVYRVPYRVDDGNAIDVSLLDRWYEATAACVGSIEERPTFRVIFTDAFDERYHGRYLPDTRTILLRPVTTTYAAKYPFVAVRTYRHEVLHYVKHTLTGNPDSDHDQGFWTREGGYDCEGWDEYSY